MTGLDAQNSAYDERFEIPVFVASDDAVAQVSPVSQVYRPERVAAPPAGTIVSPGIEVSSTANEIEVVFRRGRENRLAAILLQFAILWSAVTAVVAYQDVHFVVPILLGTFTVIPLIEAFRLTFVERRIVANARSIDLIRRVGGFERRSHIDTQTIEEIVVTAVADIGMRERYRLAVRTRDGEALSLAERIPDQISAQWIGLQVGSTIGIRQHVRFRGNVAAAAPRGPIRRDRRAVATYSDEAA